MRRILSVILAATLALVLIGCGGGSSSPAPAPVDSNTARVTAIYQRLVGANNLFNAPQLVIISDPAINADNINGVIGINTGLINSALDDDEIAMVLGHELAHHTAGDLSSTITDEYAADQLGGQYMVKAGYSLCVGAKIIQRFGDTASSDHPAGTDRYTRLGCQ